jgi:sensor histidine kinase regulating citrate/malate metabolism
MITITIVILLFYFSLLENTEKQIARQARSTAYLAASRLDVVAGYLAADPPNALAGIANELMRNTNAAFVVFMDLAGIRYTHPNPDLISKPFTGGDETLALSEGKSYVSKAVGISGPSIRAFAPISGFSGNLLGAVAVGYWEPDVSEIIWDVFKILYIIIPVSLASIGIFSCLLAATIKETLFGMEPSEISTKLKERETMLESVREGIVAIDANCRITVVNSAARQIFAPEHNILGRHVAELIPNTRLPIVLSEKRAELDQQMLLNGHVVLANRIPLLIKDRSVGAISTFRDMTEINSLAEELTGARKLVDLLRAKSHEFMNKLHAISGLIQLEQYTEAHSYITRLADKEQSFIEFLLKNIKNPATAGLLEGKAAKAQERNITLTIHPGSRLYLLPPHFDDNSMIVVLGNLIENAMDSVQELPQGKGWIAVLILQNDAQILIKVTDNGPGIRGDVIDKIFNKGFTTKPLGMGYGLANVQTRVGLASGSIKVNSHDGETEFIVIIPSELL